MNTELIHFDKVPFKKKPSLLVTKEPLSQSPISDFITKLLKDVPTSVQHVKAAVTGMDKHGKPIVSRAAVWGADKDGKLAFYCTDADEGFDEAVAAIEEFHTIH